MGADGLLWPPLTTVEEATTVPDVLVAVDDELATA